MIWMCLLFLADDRRYLELYCFAPILVLNYGCCCIIQTNVLKSEVPCVSKLSGYIKQYKKGKLSIEDKLSLMDNVTIASKRAKKLSPYKNPSTTIYELIEELDKLKGKN